MRIEAGSAPLPKGELTHDDQFDIALVVVHGMGNAYRSQILLEWAEPILERIDWLTRDRTLGAKVPQRFGVTVARSDLSAPIPTVTAEVGVPMPSHPDGREVVRLAILEARWSESFAPMLRRQVFRWAITFLWRTIRRMLVQFGRNMVRIPSLMVRARDAQVDSERRLLARAGLEVALAFNFVKLVIGLLGYIAVCLFVVGLGLIATLVLPLLSPLLLFKWFKDKAQAVIDGVVESIGDVATWKERPLRASAMRLVLRDALAEAARLVGADPERRRRDRVAGTGSGVPSPRGRVQVLAHSQGAALAAYALFSEQLDPADYAVSRLTTVGAAVVLMGRERWKGRPDEYRPVQAWLEKAPAVVWENRWALWDPFSAGPIADDVRSMRERWREAYFPRPQPGSRKFPPAAAPAAANLTETAARKEAALNPTTEATNVAPVVTADAGDAASDPQRVITETKPGEPPLGPAEYAVHNTSQPFLDHSEYYANTLQVVEPVARSLLPPKFHAPRPEVAYIANRLIVIDKQSLGLNMIFAIVIAGCTPGLDEVSRTLASWFGTIRDAVASVLVVILPGPSGNDGSSAGTWGSFLIDEAAEPPELSAWGWAVASGLLLALLIWLNQLLADRTTRCLVWNRCPPKPWRWLIVSSLPRLAYAAVAAWVVCLSFPEDRWLLLRVFVVIAAVLLFIGPFVAPVPLAVPARVPPHLAVAGAGEGREIPLPYTLRGAVRGVVYRSEFRRRSNERLRARIVQDREDDQRAPSAGGWWRLKRRLRVRVVRPVEDFFFLDRSSPIWKRFNEEATGRSAAPRRAGRRP